MQPIREQLHEMEKKKQMEKNVHIMNLKNKQTTKDE